MTSVINCSICSETSLHWFNICAELREESMWMSRFGAVFLLCQTGENSFVLIGSAVEVPLKGEMMGWKQGGEVGWRGIGKETASLRRNPVANIGEWDYSGENERCPGIHHCDDARDWSDKRTDDVKSSRQSIRFPLLMLPNPAHFGTSPWRLPHSPPSDGCIFSKNIGIWRLFPYVENLLRILSNS